MPTNIKELNGKWRYFEGTTSAATILADLSKVMCLGVRTIKNDIIIERNWDIVYPAVDINAPNYIPPKDKRSLTPAEFKGKIKNQLKRITDRVILKTMITSQATEFTEIDDLAADDGQNATEATVYVEFYKPDYLINPERPTPDEVNNESVDEPSLNNHFILIRASDGMDAASHTSEWAKLSWYRDFHEIDVDGNDSNNVKCIEFATIDTPGLNSETSFNFYINTNNERAIIVLVGNPSLEFAKDGISNHLISMAYMGRIESFAGSINDTVGNFALTTSSSTMPCCGVSRDEFGNVINIVKSDKYGKNTATCVTDIGMLRSHTKAYWQAHMAMFNATRESMVKEMYGKSAYTSEYYADKIKVAHTNDGLRGMLDGCVIVNKSGIYPLDELVINRDFIKQPNERQEIYVYMPITADYSFLANSPNSLNGIAILKDVSYPDPKDNAEVMKRVIDDLYIGRVNSIVSDFELPSSGLYEAEIVWSTNQEDRKYINVYTTQGLAIVTRPEESEDDIQIDVTATITVGSGSDKVIGTKIFKCVVLKKDSLNP